MSFQSTGKSESVAEQIILEKKSASHWEIIFNRPNKYNAITSYMYERVTEILNEASKDDQLVLLSITGQGKFYSSGTDLAEPTKAFSLTNSDIQTIVDRENLRLQKFIESFIRFPKILIAFVNGPAIGVSVTTLALCDGVYASSSSTFALPFVRTALVPEGCSSYLFPRLMGSLHAKEVLLFDRKLTAIEAQQKGLVTQVIDDKLFQQEKQKICEHILSLPKGSLLTSKAMIQRWPLEKLQQVNEHEVENLKKRWSTDEFLEAMLVFINRKPKSKL